MEQSREEFTFFWGGPFSQWASSLFVIDGVTFGCAEQYMMYKKALMFSDYHSVQKIMATNNPKVQKALGRKVKDFHADEWNKYCRKIVYDATYAKFTQNPDLLAELKKSIGTEIVEASPLDKIWGVGLHTDNKDIVDKTKWTGLNWLGIALMQVRDQLEKEGRI